MKKSLFLLAALTLAGCSHHRGDAPPPSPEMAACHEQLHQVCPEAIGPEQVGECLAAQNMTLAKVCPELAAKREAKEQCHQLIDKLCPNAGGPEEVGECLVQHHTTFATVCPAEAEQMQKHRDEWREHHMNGPAMPGPEWGPRE